MNYEEISKLKEDVECAARLGDILDNHDIAMCVVSKGSAYRVFVPFEAFHQALLDYYKRKMAELRERGYTGDFEGVIED